MAFKCLIGGVDVSVYLKQIDTSPGGDGLPGSGRLYLDQEAGGLDLRPMQLVQVWKTHTGDAGVATKGRIFGGHVNVRDTGNVGTTKLWALNCWDHSILLHKLVRDRQPALAVVLTADTFGAQISTLIQQIQRNGGASVRTAIEATIRVADLWPTMPAVTYPGGHKLGWYIQQLCDTVHLLDSAVFPHFYMDVSNSYGILESFDTPYLVVYDGAQLPAASLSFSDVVAGGRKPIFGTFKRVTDATAMSQRRQSRFGSGLVVTSENNVSQALYPCEYINHGDDPGGNSGKWMNETFEDSESVSFAAAQARIDAIVASESTPRETFEFETPERVLPGETIGLGWSLDGIADDTEYTVAKVQVKIEPPDVLWSKLTVNARRIGLFDNNLSVFAAPSEGDTIPPLPPASASVTSNTFNWDLELAELVLLIGVSPSPDASGYVVVGTLTSPTGDIEPYERDVGLNLTPSLYAEPGHAYSLRVHAYDNAANRSDPFPAAADPALTGTTALPSVPAPTGLQVDTTRGTAGYEYRSGTQAQVYIALTPPATLPDYYIFRMGADGADPALWTPHIVHRDTTSFLVPDVLATGSTYDGDIVAVRGSIRSSVANMTAFTVPAYTGPPAPVLVSVSVGVAPKSGGYARVRLTSAVTVGGGYAFARRLTGDLTDVPIISVAIPPDFASPYFAIFNNLTVGASYEFSAIVFDELGVENPVPSNTIQATITYVPDPDVEDSSFDVSFPDDDGLRGWEVVEGDGLDLTWSQAVTYDGRTSLVILDTNSTHSAFAGPLYAAKGSETIAIKQAQRRSTGTGSAPNARMEVWEYDDADVKTETTLYDVLSTTSFVLFDGKHALLSSTRYFRIMLQAQNNGGSGYSVYFSPPRIRRQVNEFDVADDAILGAHINPVFDLTDQVVTLGGTSKILAGGGLVTIDTDGIKLGGTATGTNNIDFYNEVAVRGARVYGMGIAGDFTLVIAADYNGGGQTAVSIASQDLVEIGVAASGLLFGMGSLYGGFVLQGGAITLDNNTTVTGTLDVTGNITAPNIIPDTLIDAKGDLIAGSAADTAARLAVGSNGQMLIADSAQSTGLAWSTPNSGSGASGRVALWSGTNVLTSDTGITFNTGTDTLTVAGGANFGGDMAVDASGGTSGSPRVLGLTNLGYARIQVGDAFTSAQSHSGGRFVFQAYHGISFWGARATTGSVQGFEAGGGGADPSVRIYGSQSGTKVAAIQGAASQSANLLDFENSAGTVLSGIGSVGEFKFGTLQVVGARKTGWALATGTPTRTTFVTSTVTLPQLAERVMALIADLHATAGHGLIGT